MKSAVVSGIHELWIDGVALWSTALPGWTAARSVFRGEAEPPTVATARPSPALLPPAERRRAPDTVAVALEVAARACESAGREPKDLPSVFASTHGDLAVTDYMCATLAKTPELTSPTRFHNSVHNAAAGYWAIATGCVRPYTALSAFEHTFGIGLLEASLQALAEAEPVLFVAYDIEARGPLQTMARSRGAFGAALVLAPQASPRALAKLKCEARVEDAPRPSPPRPANARLVEGNAMASCLGFFEALAEERPRSLVQTLGPRCALGVHLEPCR